MKKFQILKYEFLPLVLMAAIGFIFFGCSPPKSISIVDRKIPTGLQERSKIAVLINTKPYFSASPNDKKIFSCISNSFTKMKLEERLVPADNFRNIAFSDSSLSEYSYTKEAIELIMINPPVLEKIKSIGIRYIVLVGEPQISKRVVSEYSGGKWVLVCCPPMPMPDYAKSKTTEVTISIHGDIFDIKHSCVSGKILSLSSGESYYYLSPPLVFGWPSGASESQACKEFGEAVAKFIAGQETNE